VNVLDSRQGVTNTIFTASTANKFFSPRNFHFSDLNSINLKIDRREIELGNLKSPSRQKLFKEINFGNVSDFKFQEKNLMAQSEVYLESLGDIIT
jgi:hypothetical protein